MENLMKKLLQCLCLLLIVPAVSVFALTGCKDKNNGGNKPREYISYSEADSILTSAYTALYGEELEPNEPPASPSTPVAFVANAASANDIKLIKAETTLESVQINNTDFTTNVNGEIKISDSYYMYVSSEAYIPIAVVRALLREGITNIIGNTIEFSYENKKNIEPNSLKCKARVNVYENVFAIEMQREYDSTIETTIVNIVFDSNLKATNVLLTTSKGEGSANIFAFVSYNLTTRATSVLKLDTTTTAIQNQIQGVITEFEAIEATKNTTFDFASLYVNFT